MNWVGFFGSLKHIAMWPLTDLQFCIGTEAFSFWGCQLAPPPAEIRRGSPEFKILASDPFFVVLAQHSLEFWKSEPQRIYDAALALGWKGAKKIPAMTWQGRTWDTTLSHFPQFSNPCFTIKRVPKSENWYISKHSMGFRKRPVGTRKWSPLGKPSLALPGEIVKNLPVRWQITWFRHFNPLTGDGMTNGEPVQPSNAGLQELWLQAEERNMIEAPLRQLREERRKQYWARRGIDL